MRKQTRLVLAGLTVAWNLWCVSAGYSEAQGTAPQVQLPSELERIDFPSGKELAIECKDISLLDDGRIQVQLSYVKAPRSRKKGLVDGVAVFYLTKYADLQADATSYSGPAGIVAMWNKTLSMSSGLGLKGIMSVGSGSFEASDRLKRTTGGVAAFTIKESSGDKIVTASGALPPPLGDITPQVLGIVAMSEGSPVSNFIWVPLPGPADKAAR